jgi:diguanylate cyclase (GGDEF)-like protein
MGDEGTLRIVQLCLTIERAAVDFYSAIAADSKIPELRAFWTSMSHAEQHHLRYWETLVAMAGEAELPAVFDDPEGILRELEGIIPVTEGILRVPHGPFDLHDAFLAAYKLEFHMLHPAFATLFSALSAVTGGDSPEVLYEAHLDALVGIVAKYGHSTPEMDVLGGALKRLWRENRRLAGQAHSDGLTGLLTRRAFLNTAEHLCKVARRREEDLALIMLDVDDFKKLNDSLGHQHGDVALRTVASVIKAGVRTSDLVGRFGGEEFIVLLYGAGPEAARAIADKIRRAVAEAPVLGQRITLSAGVAAGRIREDAGKELDGMIRRADKLLLDAKRSGKNMVASEIVGDV